MNRYQALIDAYAQRDQLAVMLTVIALGIIAGRLVIASNPLKLTAKWQRWALGSWDGYILLVYVGILVYGLVQG